ncbi:atrial natriuretic peptide receptor 3-like isoform X1 [Patiria miniata]|uniref:Receptor ligand binding region domain-containing protein n=1 Tax=Patiria miniata TaxID=46514 RepID=A0A914A896_PATMI|nr:atrial natriuretic peptide receptor 3-like isoform X1 [Patiria miniata]
MVAMYGSIILAPLLLSTVVHATVNVKVGMLHLSDCKEPPVLISKYSLLPAAQIAFETVAKRLERGVYKNFSMTHVSTDECCTRPVRSSGALASSMYHDDGVDAFLGPAVSPDMAAVADMAAYWNLPVLAGAATSTLLDDKTRFPTLTRACPGMGPMVQFMTAVLRHLGLTSCAILRGLPVDVYYRRDLPDAVFAGLERNGIIVVEVYADQFDTLDKALEKVASFSKVIFISASPVRDIMVHAHRLGLTRGSHVFLNWIPFEHSPWQTSSQFENNDAETVEALKALLMMRYHVPDTPVYHAFQRELKDRQLTLYGRELGSGENLFAAATYDAVLIYADVINEIVAEGGDVRDGRVVTKKMWDRTFQGVTGAVRISANGDRLGVCDLVLDMTDTKKGTFDVIGTFDEATGAIIVHEPIKCLGGKAPTG